MSRQVVGEGRTAGFCIADILKLINRSLTGVVSDQRDARLPQMLIVIDNIVSRDKSGDISQGKSNDISLEVSVLAYSMRHQDDISIN